LEKSPLSGKRRGGKQQSGDGNGKCAGHAPRSDSLGISAAPTTAVPNGDVLEGILTADMVEDAAVKGDQRAGLAIVEFSDYQCPYCGRFARETHPQLEHDFVDTGKIRYIFLNLPLDAVHPHARQAAEAAECARGQSKYWEMHRRLFASPQALAESNLLQYGSELGLDTTHFAACLKGKMSSKIDKDQEIARRFGVIATPTFLIGTIEGNAIRLRRILKGALPYSTFKTALEELLG
jgi:protein-disulfide isomerase